MNVSQDFSNIWTSVSTFNSVLVDFWSVLENSTVSQENTGQFFAENLNGFSSTLFKLSCPNYSIKVTVPWANLPDHTVTLNFVTVLWYSKCKCAHDGKTECSVTCLYQLMFVFLLVRGRPQITKVCCNKAIYLQTISDQGVCWTSLVEKRC